MRGPKQRLGASDNEETMPMNTTTTTNRQADQPPVRLVREVIPARQATMDQADRGAGQGAGRSPGLLLLHGRGSDEHDLLGLAPLFDSRFTLISARAPLPFMMGGYMWYGVAETGATNG